MEDGDPTTWWPLYLSILLCWEDMLTRSRSVIPLSVSDAIFKRPGLADPAPPVPGLGSSGLADPPHPAPEIGSFPFNE